MSKVQCPACHAAVDAEEVVWEESEGECPQCQEVTYESEWEEVDS